MPFQEQSQLSIILMIVISGINCTINVLTQASLTKWEELVKLTVKDHELQDVLLYTKNGWSEKHKKIAAAEVDCHSNKELYVTKESIICRGQ